jgi:hypothetical protein
MWLTKRIFGQHVALLGVEVKQCAVIATADNFTGTVRYPLDSFGDLCTIGVGEVVEQKLDLE